MKSKTYTAGANAEQTAIIAKLRRELKLADSYAVNGENLMLWLLNRDDRYNRKKGGVGK